MRHSFDPSASPLQRVLQHAQRTIAIAVVGCAALALWAGPAAAADTQASSNVQAPVAPTPASNVPATADQASDTVATVAPEPADVAVTVPVPAPDVPQVSASAPAVPAAAPAPTPTVRNVTSKASASIDTAVPGSDAVAAAKVGAVQQTLNQVSDSAGVDGAAGSVADLGSSSPAADQPVANPPGREMLRGGMTPPRSIAASAISISVKHVMLGMDRFASPFSLQVTSGPLNDGGASSASGPVSDDGLPSLPGPLQIPVLGSSGSTSTSSSGFFFFGFAGLLVGLWAAFAPALSRHLQGSPASWRPAPYLSLLELPG
jgi:hypothetical protein